MNICKGTFLFIVVNILLHQTIILCQVVTNNDGDTRAAAQWSAEDCLCQCSTTSFLDASGKYHGNCQSADDSGAQWCYVKMFNTYGSTCYDQKQSTRDDSLSYSYHACATPELNTDVCNFLISGGSSGGGFGGQGSSGGSSGGSGSSGNPFAFSGGSFGGSGSSGGSFGSSGGSFGGSGSSGNSFGSSGGSFGGSGSSGIFDIIEGYGRSTEDSQGTNGYDNLIAGLLAGGTGTDVKPKPELGNNIKDAGDNEQDKQKPTKLNSDFNKLVFGR